MIELFENGTIDHVEHTGPFIIHFDFEGQIILIEILDASEFLSSLIKTTIRCKEDEIGNFVYSK
jgi:uncharacterized protein YuzE